MKDNIKHILIKITIILMAFFVYLPCSVKREVKQTLNVAHLQHSEKPNKTVVCQTFTKKETRKFSVSYQKKELQKHPYNFDFTFCTTTALQQNIFLFEKIKFSAPVPIYILHEQYLI